jgi:hypothetical protein
MVRADEPDQAEYNRLTQELELLAGKNAWVGAERAFTALLATGVDASFEDLMRGAHAARAIGDVTAVRERLELAKDVREEREVIDWLWQLDEHFGPVWLACDPGSLLRLETEAQPFDPDQQRAIEFAQSAIAEDCAFDGLLPAGEYRFYETVLKVEPRVQGVRIDLRGVEIDRKTRRKLQKAAKQEDDETS